MIRGRWEILIPQTAATSALRDFAPNTSHPVEELNALDRLLDDGTTAAALPSVHSFIRSGQKSPETPMGSSTSNQPPERAAPATTATERTSGRKRMKSKTTSMVERREKAAARARVRPVNPGTGAEFSRTREAGGVGSTTRPAHGLSAQHLSALGDSSAFDPARAPNAETRAQNASALGAGGDFGSDAGDDGFGDQVQHGTNGSGGAEQSQTGRRRSSLGMTARERRALALASSNAAMRQVVAAKKGRVLGARCTLNYKGLGVMYPGRIARVHGDGTYDVDLNAPATLSSGGIAVAFSDDLEARVPGEWVFPDYVEVGYTFAYQILV